MADRDEEVTVKTTMPIASSKSPVRDASEPPVKEIIQDSTAPLPESAAYKAMSPDERAQRRAMIVTALERGVVNDRMSVILPSYLHGEWVKRDPMEIAAMEKLGFRVETEYGKDRALNSDGSGAVIVHDVVFMTTPRENKDLIDDVKKEIAYKLHNPRGPQREEKEFASRTRDDTGGVIPTMLESKTREAKRESIAEAIQALNNQTAPQPLPR